jgi:GMP synthase (glutamine-hydrolysing)
MIKEITARELNIDGFIKEKIKEIKEIVGDGMAINALSGGVDSSTVTMLGHRALGNRLKTAFIDNGITREGEAGQVVGLFRNLGVKVEVIDARKEFFSAFKGITDPEEKRETVTQTFYRDVWSRKAVRNTSFRGLS